MHTCLAHAAALAVAVLVEREEPLGTHQLHRLLEREIKKGGGGKGRTQRLAGRIPSKQSINTRIEGATSRHTHTHTPPPPPGMHLRVWEGVLDVDAVVLLHGVKQAVRLRVEAPSVQAAGGRTGERGGEKLSSSAGSAGSAAQRAGVPGGRVSLAVVHWQRWRWCSQPRPCPGACA